MTKNKNILKFEIINTIFIILLGTFLHFSFNISNKNLFIGTFSSINESIWEHLKLIFFPMLLTTLIGHIHLKKTIPNYITIKTKAIILSITSIIIIYYSYTGIIGKNIALINIILFIFSSLIGEYYTYKKTNNTVKNNNFISIILLGAMFLFFINFTFNPPHIGIFKDPITNTYGIFKEN